MLAPTAAKGFRSTKISASRFAFWCDEAYAEMRRKAAETALAVLEGGEVRNRVDRGVPAFARVS